MPVDTSSKAARRQIADEFKDRKVPRGIFAVRCSTNGDAWVGSSPNLSSAQNSLWFQLRGGLSRHQALQNAWKQHGEESFTFEVLEQFDDDTSPLLLSELYTRKKKEWAESLPGQVL
ncbi:MAG TPA: GIY-YIG nuclease family protein [Acidobacteriaceae bacterium]